MDTSPVAVVAWSLEDAIGAMDRWEVGPIRAWLEARLCVGDLGVSVADLAAVESSSWWNAETGGDPQELAMRILDVAHRSVPDAVGPLLLYYRHVGLAAWEESWGVEEVLGLIERVTDWVARCPDEDDLTARDERTACGALLAFLATEIRVFATGIAETLEDWALAADRARQEAQTHAAAIWPGATSPCVDYARACFAREVEYYSMVARAAEAAAGFRAKGTVDVDSLDTAIAALAQVPAAMDRAERSEIRAHRHSLSALREHVTDEWLVVERGRLALVFPFGLGGVADPDVVARAREDAMGWRLADLPVVSVSSSLPISDAWNSSDPLGRAFRGMAMRLPEIEVVASDGSVRQRMRPSLWLSELGNHLLRLDCTLEGLGPVELFETVRVASPEYFGATRLGHPIRPISPSIGAQSWDSLSDFASRCIHSLRDCLADPGLHPVAHSSAQAYFALAILDEVQAWRPSTGELRTVERSQEVLSLFGTQVLTQPIWANLTSVAQWAQVPLAEEPIRLPSLGSFHASMTDNSALLVGFGTPSYAIDLLAECVLFAASVDALFETWYGELARMNRRNEEKLTRVTVSIQANAMTLTSDEVLAIESDLQDSQVEIHDFVLRCRSILLFIESPTLLQFGTLRTLLDRFLESCAFTARRASFLESSESMTHGALGSILERVRARVLENEERRRRANERRARLAIDALLAGVAVAGLSGLASLVQAGYRLGALPTGMLTVTVVLASLLIALGVWRVNRRH